MAAYRGATARYPPTHPAAAPAAASVSASGYRPRSSRWALVAGDRLAAGGTDCPGAGGVGGASTAEPPWVQKSVGGGVCGWASW